MTHGLLSILLAEAHEEQRQGHDVAERITRIIEQFETERDND